MLRRYINLLLSTPLPLLGRSRSGVSFFIKCPYSKRLPYTTNMKKRCRICGKWGINALCRRHEKVFMWDSSIQGFRLKKRSRGSRYTIEDFHKSEIKLTKIIEDYYGSNVVVTAFHPIWAETPRKVLYEFDIFIKNTNILIEYNGKQHYEFTPFFHKYERNFRKQQQRDNHKAKLALDNGYNLIIFRYDEPIFKDYVLDKIESTR